MLNEKGGKGAKKGKKNAQQNRTRRHHTHMPYMRPMTEINQQPAPVHGIATAIGYRLPDEVFFYGPGRGQTYRVNRPWPRQVARMAASP